MLHCVNITSEGNCSDDMTVLQRQRLRMRWQQEEQHGGMGFALGFMGEAAHDHSALAEVVAQAKAKSKAKSPSMKPDPNPPNGWPTMGIGSSAVSAASTSTHSVSVSAKHTCKKRKSDNAKVVGAEKKRERVKGSSGEEDESKMTEQDEDSSKNTRSKNKRESACGDHGSSSKENSKASEVQKPDYIHVRARRGQATDSHSLAERVRREKISERMKYLQDLVPGCNKITGKAGMLDEIINYVQSLQRQVEFLSMKLAAVNPRLDFNLDDLFSKQVFGGCGPSFGTIGMGTEMNNLACVELNTAQQIVSCCGLDMGVSTIPTDMGLTRSISAPDTFFDITQILPSSSWESDFHNLSNVSFDQARAETSFPSQPFTGLVEASIPKMEM